MINVSVNQVDVKAFNEAVNNIVATSKRDLKTVISQQAKLLSVQLMHYTPPFAGGKIPGGQDNGSTKADQRAGMAAVKADILKTMTVPSILFGGVYRDKWLEKAVQKKDHVKVQQYLDNVKSKVLSKYRVAQFSPDLHTNIRVNGRRFRPRSAFRLILEERQVQKYIKDMQKTVGYMKAGWGVAISFFGGTVPSWVKDKLSYAKGTVGVLEESPTTYTVEISNSTPTVERFSSNYNVAVRMRTNALVRQFNDYLQKNIQSALRK